MRPSSSPREGIGLILVENSNRPSPMWRIFANGHGRVLLLHRTGAKSENRRTEQCRAREGAEDSTNKFAKQIDALKSRGHNEVPEVTLQRSYKQNTS